MEANPFTTGFAGAKPPKGMSAGIVGQPSAEKKDPVVLGGLLSPVPGRTDKLEISVPTNSYVLPADIVSALGEGNTLAGTQVLDDMFDGLGAKSEQGVDTIPIIAAGGEYVIGPDQVTAIGNGDVSAGHRLLDAFVKEVRADLVKTLKNLPGPAK